MKGVPMKRTIFFIACLLISILAYPETTKPDYSDVSWGMTLDELIARGVTEGVTAQGEKRLSRQRQYHGFDMSEEFKLDGGLLTKVILTASSSAWQYLTNDLYVKYGAHARKVNDSIEWATTRASANIMKGYYSVWALLQCTADLSAIRNKIFKADGGL